MPPMSSPAECRQGASGGPVTSFLEESGLMQYAKHLQAKNPDKGCIELGIHLGSVGIYWKIHGYIMCATYIIYKVR